MKKLFRSKKFYISAALVLVIILFVSLRGPKEEYSYAAVIRADLTQEVSVTGKVEPVESVSLSFERGGRVSSVVGLVGTSVSVGQALVRLETTSDYLALAQEEAKLSELTLGTRPEDIAILESKRDAAEIALTQSKQALLDSASDSYTTSDNAVHNYADQFFDNPRTASPLLNITTSDEQLRLDLNNKRSILEKELKLWAELLSSVSIGDDMTGLLATTRRTLESTKVLLDKLAIAVNSLTSNQSLSATTISTYKSNISAARSAVNDSVTALTSDETAFSSAIAALDLAQKNLQLARAGTLPVQIEAQKAKVASLQHTLAVSVLRSPINGVVTKQDAKVGQVVAANQEITSIISEHKLELTAYVPEVDIGAMAVGNSALVSFDAFPGETFTSTITYIEPAETIIDGVPTYKIKLSVASDDARIRPGMTANLSVTVAERKDVLAVPYRAVMGQNGDRRVLLSMPGGEKKEVSVVIGIRGVQGDVEVISGLSEGDSIAIPVRK